MNRLSKLIILSLLISLYGCGGIQLQSVFNPKEAEYINAKGENSIKGTAYITALNGDTITCAGNAVGLFPVNAYSRELFTTAYGNSDYGLAANYPNFVNKSNDFIRMMRTTKCDEKGNFEFDNLAEGEYFIETATKYRLGSSPTIYGGAIMKRVKVESGKSVKTVLNSKSTIDGIIDKKQLKDSDKVSTSIIIAKEKNIEQKSEMQDTKETYDKQATPVENLKINKSDKIISNELEDDRISNEANEKNEVKSEPVKLPTKTQLKAIQDSVKEALKDPYSAKFKNIKVSGLSYCGEVNAKNSMGGYTGYTKFTGFIIMRGKAAVAVVSQIDSQDMPVARMVCADMGM